MCDCMEKEVADMLLTECFCKLSSLGFYLESGLIVLTTDKPTNCEAVLLNVYCVGGSDDK